MASEAAFGDVVGVVVFARRRTMRNLLPEAVTIMLLNLLILMPPPVKAATATGQRRSTMTGIAVNGVGRPVNGGSGVVMAGQRRSTATVNGVFIEKILRSTPTVGKLYLLIKAENKAAATERLQTEIIDSELFICLKQMFGDSYQNIMIEKLVPVLGNVCEANLGMDADLAGEIASEVDVIVNSAANTCFDERYDVALNTNTMGPYRLLSFAKLCKKLQMFMHVSTAYVNGEREGVVFEKSFKMGESIAAERARSVAERSSMPMLDIEAELSLAALTVANSTANVSQKMKDLGVQRAKAYGWQNTYMFTKAMGEMVLSSMRGDIPLVIMRPSVIECIAQEPVPGWIQGNR
ncbi:hypothetical protein QQ045_003097 [Rhodiola kirilowii]